MHILTFRGRLKLEVLPIYYFESLLRRIERILKHSINIATIHLKSFGMLRTCRRVFHVFPGLERLLFVLEWDMADLESLVF